MKEGKVIFSFDCGTGEAVISSSKSYADGEWHNVCTDFIFKITGFL